MELDMVCTCEPDGFLPTEERRLRIYNRMRLEEREDLTKAIVLSLAFDFGACVDVFADQWFGVSLETPLSEDGLYVQCDHPEDGIAALWEHLAERFPERVSAKDARSDRRARVAALVSAALVDQYKVAESHWRGSTRSECDSQNDAYHAALELFVLAERTIRNMWGAADLDLAADRAMDA